MKHLVLLILLMAATVSCQIESYARTTQPETDVEETEILESESIVEDDASPSEETQSDSASPEASQNELESFTLNSVVISEVVADPQQDHNDSTGGNGIAFDDLPGEGTIGATDEYVELYNGSEAVVDLTSWQLVMEDGTDETQNLDEESWEEAHFSLGGSFSEFQVGEFLVLGNPEGAINNEVTLSLYDEAGSLVESLFIEDANASGLEDEAYSLDFETGYWAQDEASPGYFLDD